MILSSEREGEEREREKEREGEKKKREQFSFAVSMRWRMLTKRMLRGAESSIPWLRTAGSRKGKSERDLVLHKRNASNLKQVVAGSEGRIIVARFGRFVSRRRMFDDTPR